MKGCRDLSGQEVRKMLESANIRDQVLFLSELSFGLRVSETLSLTFGDVADGFLFVRSQKGSDNVSFPVPQQFRSAVQELKKFYQRKGVKVTAKTSLFLGNRGWNKPIGRHGAYQIIKRLSEKLDIQGRVGNHSFRKSFVKRIYEETKFDIVRTRLYSRHKSISSLDYYISTTENTDLVNNLAW